MSAIQMPTVQHLLNGSLDVFREAIESASAEQEPTRWVVTHLVFGSAMRLRAALAADEFRTRMYADAISAFDTALAVCANNPRERARSALNGTIAGAVGQQQSTLSGQDGVQLVVESTTMPVTEGNELLERAVELFRDTCAKTSRRTDLSAWFIAMSNLGCALILLGRRTPGMAGQPLLEEAVDVFQESLRIPLTEKLTSERAKAQVNLSEALQALAERGMPAESVRYLEQATDWLAAALCHFAPAEYRWLLQLEPGRMS